MFYKMFQLFKRDLKVGTRDFITVYIMVFPLLFAAFIQIFTPGLADTTVSLAVVAEEGEALVDYLSDFSKVEVFSSLTELEDRVSRRDHMVGVLKDEAGGFYLLTEGNEPDYVLDLARQLVALKHFDLEEGPGPDRVFFVSRGQSIPPLKKMLVNVALMFNAVLGGMIIALNIVEEKTDNTLAALHVTPISRLAYMLGKSLIGLVVPLVGSVLLLLLTGFYDVNLFHATLLLLSSCLISILLGFIEGINNDDIMNAAGNIKVLFLPMLGAMAGIEFLSDKWQPLFYWIPFYWTYKGNDLVLSKQGSSLTIIFYVGLVLLISMVVFLILAPRIRKGLE